MTAQELVSPFDGLTQEKSRIEGLLASNAKQWQTIKGEVKKLRDGFGPATPLGRRRTHTGEPPKEIFHELTVRMHDEGALVLPGEFIPAAERYNVMPAIDRWVIRQATQLVREWPAAQRSQLMLAVNLSGTSLNEQSFIEFVLQHAGDREVARHLCFEITETAAVSNLSDASYFMRELKTRGCRFALDDFGSGLSSFMYLKTLPVDFLKIEGQFISRIAQDAVDRSLVEAVANLGRSLGICTIAESVETEASLEVLREIGVDYVQGYHIARPQPIAELGFEVKEQPPLV